MNRTSEKFLAGSGLSEDQNCCIARRDLLSTFQDAFKRIALSDDLTEVGSNTNLLLQVEVLMLEPILQYLNFCERSFAPYLSRIAIAQIRRATRLITAYSGSMPLEKKNERFGAKSSICMPRER